MTQSLGAPDAWRWRFKNGNDKTWRYCATRPQFDPELVEAEPMYVLREERRDIPLTPTDDQW